MVPSEHRDGIHCRIDPEQTWEPPEGGMVQEVSVVMTDDHRFDSRRGRAWLEPAACALTPGEARESPSIGALWQPLCLTG